MPGWYKVCRIGRSEQQVHNNSLLHFEFRVQVWLLHSCVCKSYIDMDHLGTNLDQFVWVPSIAEISSRFFEDN